MYKEMVTYDGPQVAKGFITVSDKPGIGVEINEEGMRRYATPGRALLRVAGGATALMV